MPVTATGFEPFGWLPVADTDPADGTNRLEFEWGDPHLNLIRHGPEEVERVGEALRCERMFRHKTHTQALLVLDAESVLAVAPANVDLSSPSDVESVRAFRLKPLDAFVLRRGTWHWGPFPLGREAVHLYNLQGFSYTRDNESADLSSFELSISVGDDC